MRRVIPFIISCLAIAAGAVPNAFARDITYKDEEVAVYVAPGEPTQVKFPGKIAGGFKKKQSSISLDKRETDLIVFAQEEIPQTGESLIVRLTDGRAFSMRVRQASTTNPRDAVVKIEDSSGAPVGGAEEEEETLPYQEKNFEYAPPSRVSGLMREMVLNAEFGKAAIPGYRVSDRFNGETILHDGTIHATVEKIFIGPSLWGYVVNAENLLTTSQKVNPSTFRLDGTRAISATNWELSGRPADVEQELSGKHKAKIYIVTRAKR